MPDIYEETAEQFLSTMAGRFCGMSKSALVEHFKARFPSEDAFREMVSKVRKEAEVLLAEAQARPLPGQSLGFGYAIDGNRPKLH